MAKEKLKQASALVKEILEEKKTARRARQKIQSENPHLASNRRISKLRAENETIYREFATGKVG